MGVKRIVAMGLMGPAASSPSPERRRIRTPAGEDPDPAAVRALEAQGFVAVGGVKVGWAVWDPAYVDHWFERPGTRPSTRPIRRRG